MVIQKNCESVKNTTTPIVSKVFPNANIIGIRELRVRVESTCGDDVTFCKRSASFISEDYKFCS
jgi:hypothetical protein